MNRKAPLLPKKPQISVPELKMKPICFCRGVFIMLGMIIIALCAHIVHCQVSQGSLERQKDGECRPFGNNNGWYKSFANLPTRGPWSPQHYFHFIEAPS
jgi:hypothetical protein